jgi:DNA-binding transcriptional regulator YiaG
MTPDEIRRVRESLGMNMREFAEKIGLTTGAISRYESGQRAPNGAVVSLLERLRDEAEKGKEAQTIR